MSIDLDMYHKWRAKEREREEREKAARVAEINRSLEMAMPGVERGSITAMQQVADLLCEKHGIKVDERTSMPSGAAAYACWSTRTITVPPITDEESFAVRLHEIGHVLSGACPGREPHRPDPNETRWHHCAACETSAWKESLKLASFSKRMFARLRRSLSVTRDVMPASSQAIQELDRTKGTVGWATEVTKRKKWQAMLDRQAAAMASLRGRR